MADPRLKQIKIKTGIVRRVAKEKICYDNEANQQRARIQKMKDESKEEYAIRKQEEVLQESLMMVPDCQRRLEKAFEELKKLLKDEKDLQDTDEYSLAKKALEEAQPLLPNPDWCEGNNSPDMAYQPLDIPCNTSFYPNSEFPNLTFLPNTNNQSQNRSFKSENFIQQKQNDEEFINNFIKIKAHNINKKNNKLDLKIFEAKKYLTDVVLMKKQLEADCEVLDVTSDDFDEKWQEIVVKQNKIIELLSKFNKESISSLQVALRKRARKRDQQKIRKLRQKEAKEEREEKIRIKHELIDKVLREKSKEVESLKRKEALKRQADSVLHEVRRKKYETKKMLNMLAALMKLRELRSQQEIAQGGYCSQQITETFNNVISHFQDLWKKQSEMYNLEEKGLKVMLEESEIPHMKISNMQNILNQWEQALFGTPSTDDNYKYMTQADNDINSLIFVRREWDQFITGAPTPLSSSIPVGWVIPPETGDADWKSFTRTKRKI